MHCTFKETIKSTEIQYLFVKMPVLRIIENPIILTNKSMLILFSMSLGYQVYWNRGSYDKKNQHTAVITEQITDKHISCRRIPVECEKI